MERQLAGAADEAGTRRLFGELERPQRYPVWQRLLADPAGFVWAEAFRTDESAPGAWMVFDPATGALGTVLAPPGLDIHQIGADFVLGVWRDPDGVHHVRIHRLSRSPRREQ